MRIIYLTLLSISLIFIGFISYDFGFAACEGTYMGSAVSFLQGCSADTINIIDNSTIDSGDGINNGNYGMKMLIVNIAEKVIAFGALFAIGAIVFSGIQYTTSFGDDEKTKKAKMTGIYALTGLVLLLVAFSLVNIIVTFIYSLGS